MTSPLPRAVVVLIGAVSLAACGLSVEADESQVCETVPFQLPAMSAAASRVSSTVSVSQQLNVPGLPTSDQIHANLFLKSVMIQPQTGAADLGFVSAMNLTADNGQPDCTRVPLMRYSRASSGSDHSISADGPQQDLISCVQNTGDASNRKLAVNMDVTGTIPQSATLGMTSCFSAKVRLSYP